MTVSLREQFGEAICINLNSKIEAFVQSLPNKIRSAIEQKKSEETEDYIAVVFDKAISYSQLITLPAYKKLHDYCSQPDVDMKVTFQHYSNVLFVYLDQKFEATEKHLRLDLPPEPPKEIAPPPEPKKGFISRLLGR